jgi:hypothetical protein
MPLRNLQESGRRPVDQTLTLSQRARQQDSQTGPSLDRVWTRTLVSTQGARIELYLDDNKDGLVRSHESNL